MFLKFAVKEAQLKKETKLIFSGLRTYHEFQYLRSVYCDLFVVRIVCSTEKRSDRYFKLNEDFVTSEARDKIENIWMQNGWENIYIDYEIDNNGTIESFYQK